MKVLVEAEETIDTFEPADNGAGPLWCHGCTVVARHGDGVFVAGLETLPDHEPLNNTRWVLYERGPDGDWTAVHRDDGRTREPSPIVLLGDRLLVSANPTLTEPGEYGGPAEPCVFEFDARSPQTPPVRQSLAWTGEPPFREHSYRTVIGDASTGHALYMQNEGYEIAHLSFFDGERWNPRGVIRWPFGSEYEPPQPLRLCYPNVQLRDGVAHYLGVGDITEPVVAWRDAKKRITGRDWDYVFRRLFYARSQPLEGAPDEGEPFGEWLELANHDATAGATRNADLWVDADGRVHVMWIDVVADERLRDTFFPDVTLAQRLAYAVIDDGRIVSRQMLASWEENNAAPKPQLARFHETAPGHAVILAQFSEESGPVYRVAPLPSGADAHPNWVDVPFGRPMAGTFLTSTVRAGNEPSSVIDLVGIVEGPALGYARVRLAEVP